MKKILQPDSLGAFVKMFFFFSMLFFLSSFSYGQTVSGKVTDANDQPLPGVTVQVKNTSRATITSDVGSFTINAGDNDILVITSIGFTMQEVSVNGRKSLNITLLGGIKNMEDVLVTALGISKQSRSIGYSATSVKPDELTINRSPNVMNALQGKVAGVNISGLGTGPAGTSKIRIRGQSSISGQNNPLIVINGIPVDNTNFGTNPGNSGSDASIGVRGGGNTSDGGDGLSSINPDDIESMTILKGAPAAALYGSRASNGVIMITTKTKGSGKGIGVTYNVNYTNEKPLDFTDYQYEYGQGENGVRPTTANPTSGQWSFGEKFKPGMTHVLYNNLVLPYEPVYNRIDKFFRNGQNLSNTVTLATGGEKGGMHMSLGNMESQGIVPNNSFDRKTINLGFSYKLNDKFSFSGNANYSKEFNANPPNIANQDNSIPTSLYNLANSFPLEVLNANKYNASGNEYIYSRFMNRTNPYWVLAEQFQNIRRDRLFGNISMKYDILPWVYVQARIGQDYWSRDQDYNNFPTGHASRGPAPAGFVNGVYTQESRRFREYNADLLASANRSFGKIGTSLTVGGNQMRRRSDLNSVQVTDFVVRGLYTVQNGRAKDPFYDLSQRGVNSVYGSAEVSYDQTIYLNGTLHNDWFSTLSPKNWSILYPSVSASYVFSENLKTSWLNFGKLRVGYAEAGSDTDVPPYADQLFYNINANLLANPAGLAQPVGNPSGSTVPNANLKPMRIAETEIGIEVKMFKSRVNLDVAAYRKITSDQIVQAQISDASGFVDTRINSGRSRNLGIEMLLTLIPVQTKNFSWQFIANSSYNITRVLSLKTDVPGERITVGTHVFNGELRQIVGMEMGQIAGFGYKRDDQGNKIFGANGLAVRTAALVNFGSALPKYVGGFTNSFTYKGVSLSALIDYKLGNKMLSGTNFNLIRHGLHKMTLQGREGGVVGDGVSSIGGGKNTAIAPVQDYWSVVRSQGLIEPVIYNGGYWKLRQITVGYEFTKYIPEKWPVKGVRLNFVANNVLIIKKWVDNIDPETFGYSSDNLVGMESTGLPSTRSIGFNLNIKF